MRVRCLIIPAAGRGTRMHSVGNGLPKELLPVGGRRAIDFALAEALAAGIADVAVVISPGKSLLRRHIDAVTGRGKPFAGLHIHYFVQERPDGEADAIGLAEPLAGRRPAALLYPDNICLPGPGALRTLACHFERLGSDMAALTEVPPRVAPAYGNSGRVDLFPLGDDLYRITRFHRKGEGPFPAAPGRLRACGLWVCGPRLFPALDLARKTRKSGEFTDRAVRELLTAGQGILGVRLPGTIFDIGNPEGYRLCRAALENSKQLDP